MSETPQANRECIHCGTERPVDEELCPSCGRPWIDGPVDEAPAAAAVAASDASASDTPASDTDAEDASASDTDASDTAADAGAAGAAAGAVAGSAKLDDTGEFTFDDWTLPPEKPKSKAVWLIPVLLLVAAIAVWTLVFLDDDGTTVTTSASPTTTEAATQTDPTTTSSPDTTTTTAAPTTTVVAYPPPESWESVGEPIDTTDLTLKAAGIGPLEFGLTIEEAAGRLTASLGEAETAGVEGLCPPDESYFLQWGELVAIFDGFDPDSLFVSYRYEDVGSDTELGLATLSGLQLGDTVAELKQIYSTFTITFEVIEGQDHFRLLDGGELLLWGPVTSDEDSGLILGIYSPTACDSGT